MSVLIQVENGGRIAGLGQLNGLVHGIRHRRIDAFFRQAGYLRIANSLQVHLFGAQPDLTRKGLPADVAGALHDGNADGAAPQILGFVDAGFCERDDAYRKPTVPTRYHPDRQAIGPRQRHLVAAGDRKLQVACPQTLENISLHAIVQFDLQAGLCKVPLLQGDIHGRELYIGNKAHGNRDVGRGLGAAAGHCG